MIRNLKVLGLALVAMLAFGAASASAAEFHTETSPTTLTGKQQTVNTFKTHAGTVHCTTAEFEGTVTTNTTTTVTVTPTYAGCTITGLGSATIDHNGCKYAITSHGSVAITGCTNANKSIVVTAPFCTVEIKESENKALSKVSFTNVGAGATREVDVKAEINNIKYIESGFACNRGATTGGIYEGTVRVTGENPVTLAHHGIWHQ